MPSLHAYPWGRGDNVGQGADTESTDQNTSMDHGELGRGRSLSNSLWSLHSAGCTRALGHQLLCVQKYSLEQKLFFCEDSSDHSYDPLYADDPS